MICSCPRTGQLSPTAKGNADLGGFIVVGADQVRSADLAEVLDHELRGVESRQQFLAAGPPELIGPDRRARAKRGAVPAAALRTMAIEDGAEFATDFVGDSLA